MGPEARCLEALERVREELERRGVSSIRSEGRLVVPMTAGELFAALMAYCEDRGLKAVGVVYEFGRKAGRLDAEARARLYEALLRIPVNYKIAVSLDEDGDLVVDFLFAGAPGVEPFDALSASTMTMARMTEWLARQLERASKGEELEPFTVSP